MFNNSIVSKKRAFKCPKCKTIQFKGKYCSLDGTKLVECDLDVENRIDSKQENDNLIHLLNLEKSQLTHKLENNINFNDDECSFVAEETEFVILNDFDIKKDDYIELEEIEISDDVKNLVGEMIDFLEMNIEKIEMHIDQIKTDKTNFIFPNPSKQNESHAIHLEDTSTRTENAGIKSRLEADSQVQEFMFIDESLTSETIVNNSTAGTSKLPNQSKKVESVNLKKPDIKKLIECFYETQDR